MNSFLFSSTDDLKILLKDKKLKKILIICGESSYKKSGAEKLLSNLLTNKQKIFFKKKLPYPDISELKDIILFIKKNSPDLIIAVGGGSVLDYAKIANVLTDSNNLHQEIINSSYTVKKNILS